MCVQIHTRVFAQRLTASGTEAWLPCGNVLSRAGSSRCSHGGTAKLEKISCTFHEKEHGVIRLFYSGCGFVGIRNLAARISVQASYFYQLRPIISHVLLVTPSAVQLTSLLVTISSRLRESCRTTNISNRYSIRLTYFLIDFRFRKVFRTNR